MKEKSFLCSFSTHSSYFFVSSIYSCTFPDQIAPLYYKIAPHSALDRYKRSPSREKSGFYRGSVILKFCAIEIIFINIFSGFSGGPYGMGPFDGPLAKRAGGSFRFSIEERRIYAMIFIKFCSGLNNIKPNAM